MSTANTLALSDAGVSIWLDPNGGEGGRRGVADEPGDPRHDEQQAGQDRDERPCCWPTSQRHLLTVLAALQASWQAPRAGCRGPAHYGRPQSATPARAGHREGPGGAGLTEYGPRTKVEW